MKKYTSIDKLSDNPFLNFFHMHALDRKGNPFNYYFVSRRKEDELKVYTGKDDAEGIVIYPLLKNDPEKLVMIRQYRYPAGSYIYELPAGLIDKGESADIAAIREMKEETGLSFTVYHGGNSAFRKPLYMGPGFTDETCRTVFGFADGKLSDSYLEDTETIQVVIVDKAEAKRILSEEKISIRCAYLLMNFLHADGEHCFDFLD